MAVLAKTLSPTYVPGSSSTNLGFKGIQFSPLYSICNSSHRCKLSGFEKIFLKNYRRYKQGHNFVAGELPICAAKILSDERQATESSNPEPLSQRSKQKGGRPQSTIIKDLPATGAYVPRSRGRSHKPEAVLNKPLEKLLAAKTKEMHAFEKAHERHLFKYPEAVSESSFMQLENEEEISYALAEYVTHLSREAMDSKGRFNIALSGGSVVKALKQLTEKPFLNSIDWSKWHIFWVDERVVPLTHVDSNYKTARDQFFTKVSIPKNQIHAIRYEHEATVVAERYESLMRELAEQNMLNLDPGGNFPCFDLVLLGLGPDGHIASLFPNSIALAEEKKWVVSVLNSPKPPPERISLTLPCINLAAHVAFVVVGIGKAEVLQRTLERPSLPGALPAQLVRLTIGKLAWFVDKAAASRLSLDAWDDPKTFPYFDYSSTKRNVDKLT